MEVYILLPSLRASLLAFLGTQPDERARWFEVQVLDLPTPYLIPHDLSQSIVTYLGELPFNKVYRLIDSFGRLEPVHAVGASGMTGAPPAPAGDEPSSSG